MKKYFAQLTLLMTLSAFVSPAVVLAQDFPAPPPTVQGRCVENCGTQLQQPLDCVSGTHQEGTVCVSNSATPSNQITPLSPAEQQGLRDAPASQKKASGTSKGTKAFKQAPVQFRNDIFNPYWWVGVTTKFTNDIFNPVWWLDASTQFTGDVFNRAWSFTRHDILPPKPSVKKPVPVEPDCNTMRAACIVKSQNQGDACTKSRELTTQQIAQCQAAVQVRYDTCVAALCHN